jgi:predicted GNAT family acetyltransferase
MGWVKAELQDFNDLEKFLIKKEVECVGFSAWLREKIISTPHIRNDFTVYIKRNKDHVIGDETIKEAVLITDQGLVYPVVTKKPASEIHDLHELGQHIHQYPNHINSIIGISRGVDLIEKVIEQDIRTRVDYHLMFLERFSGDIDLPTLPRDIKIRQASLLDALSLFDLQKRYELEEVYLNPEVFNDTACYANLKNSLRREVIFIAERNGIPVAKAGTNARGYHVWQIGGVFTHPSDRRKGLSCILMRELLEHCFKAGKSACLFVKKNNKPAIQLYKKLGFETVDSFRITYYQNEL